MVIDIKEVLMEAHNSIRKVERYYAPLRYSYEILRQKLVDKHLSKDSILQMAIKAINNIAGPNGLIPTLLVFEAYPYITKSSALSPSIIKRANAI